MSVIDHILSFLAPYECLGCSAEGDLLCRYCIQQLPTAPLFRGRYVAVWAATPYDAIGKELVARLKFSGAQAAARPIAARLASLVPLRGDMVVAPVPTAVKRIRSRGYDQAWLVARELSRKTGLPFYDCLARSGSTHQVGSSRIKRLEQLSGAFRVRGRKPVEGRNILIVDDVVTTGATLENAARTLYEAGAAYVVAAVFARA